MHTLLDLLTEIHRLGDREAVRFHNGFRTWTLSYRELYGRIGGFTCHLDERGLGKGDRIIIWGENRPEWLAAFWSCLARGVEVVPIDFRSSPRLVERIQKEVEAKLLIHGPTQAGTKLGLPHLSMAEFDVFEEIHHFDVSDIEPEDVVQIVYTSGTTGDPKGVVHRHRNICSNLRVFPREIKKYERYARPFQPIRILNMLPLSHMFGQTLGIYIPILLGTSVVFMTDLNPGMVTKTIKRERVSVLVAVPRLLSSLRHDLERRFELPKSRRESTGIMAAVLRWWRYRRIHSLFGWKFWALVVGGARLSPEEEEFWWRLGFVLIQGYGLTETSPIVATNHPLKTRRGSIGQVVESQEVRIAPDGEILIRGESVVKEYLGGAADSATRFMDGWLHTGDMGEMDDEGRLYYRGRKKDVIVTSDGLNVYPQDIETVIKKQPSVKDCVVLGVPDKQDERVHAVLLLLEPEIDVDLLIGRANEELEPHQRIRSWSVWTEQDFPRTSSTFKIKKAEVERRILTTDRAEADVETPGLMGELSQLAGKPAVEISESQRLSEDLGLSSLDRVELLSRLESDYDIELDESLFSTLSTVRDIRDYVEASTRPQSRKTVVSSSNRSTPMPRWPRRFPVPWIRHVILGTGVSFLWHRYIDSSIEGLSALEGLEPPVIFVANHTSHLDTIAVLMALPFRWRRRVAPAMQQEYFRAHFEPRGFPFRERLWRGIQYVLACGLVGAYPLPHDMAGVRRSLRFTGELVQKGYCPLVYPEGERSPNGRMGSFKPGIGLMAERLQTPIVPIHLTGMFEIYSTRDSWPRTGAVRLRMGSPMYFKPGRDFTEVAREVETALVGLGTESPP
jgi:long-chain acyl-CoA synthetase